MKIYKDEIKWGHYWLKPEYRGKGLEPFYFMWFLLSKEDRDALRSVDMKTFGIVKFWYDHPHAQLNLWFFGFAWSTQWTKMDE
tara:strand:+ start:83 stop:331 length:249 start_codon:yes stop_codon:yes gene_type:complete